MSNTENEEGTDHRESSSSMDYVQMLIAEIIEDTESTQTVKPVHDREDQSDPTSNGSGTENEDKESFELDQIARDCVDDALRIVVPRMRTESSSESRTSDEPDRYDPDSNVYVANLPRYRFEGSPFSLNIHSTFCAQGLCEGSAL